MERIEDILRNIDETLKDISESLKALAPVVLDKLDTTVPYTADELKTVYERMFKTHDPTIETLEGLDYSSASDYEPYYRAKCDRCGKKSDWTHTEAGALAELYEKECV